ncbi:Multidrug resistance-associated protein 1 [Trichoplax sp. H2]|nr:Multidrug resistance-associated protein 1 [Trichoplax sp. H2]|eukprot:RDD39615.1 Multidrug resistance-associated protein 1 [Trichoplax sp. H2]
MIATPEFQPKFGKKTKSNLYRFKLYCSAALIIPPMIDLIYTLGDIQQQRVAGVMILTPCLTWIAMVLATATVRIEWSRGLFSSSVLFLFWLLMAIAYTIKIRTLISFQIALNVMPEGLLRYVTCCIVFGGSILMLVQNVWVDRSYTKEQDGYKEDDLEESPELQSSFLSKVTFWWLNRLMIKGYKHPLAEKDLWDLNGIDKCDFVGQQFNREWMKETVKSRTSTNEDATVVTKGKGPSLLAAIGGAFGGVFLFAGFQKFIDDLLTFVSPQILRALIGFTGDKSQPLWLGFALAFIMFAAATVRSLILHQYFHLCFILGIRLKSAIIWAIYRKSLVLSNSAKKKSTTGEIVNLMSVDAQRIAELTGYLHVIWSSPFQIALAVYFLWQELGPSVLAGVGILVLLVPINAYLSMKSRNFQVKQMEHKDSRIKLMNEILNGIKVLKLYAWEKSFIEKVLAIRKLELKQLFVSQLLQSASRFAWANAPYLVALVTFSTYVLTGNELNASKAFVSISLFNILNYPIAMLPTVISMVIQVRFH